MVRASCLAVILVAPTLGGPALAEDYRAASREVVSLVRERFFDRKRAEAWAGENARYAEEARDRHEFARATRQALQRLGASHTGFYTPDDPEYYGLLSIFRGPLKSGAVEVESIGVDIAPGNFVRVVFAGSPAEKVGLQRGDKILLADGEAFHPVTSFRDRTGRAVTLTVQRRTDLPPREVAVNPRKIDPQREWLEAQTRGARIIAAGTKKVAYMPFFSAAGEPHEEAHREAIAGRFAGADALILDFRNGWGGANPNFLNLFNRTPPVLEMIDADGSRRCYDPQWRKPLFILINGGSRSGKEVVAFAVKKQKLGTLVGQRSAGAVLGGTPFLLRDRSLLLLAAADVLVDGERLEGRGVEPDVEVTDRLPSAEGKDPQLEKALELASS